MFVHDYIATHYSYDDSLVNINAYTLMRDGKGKVRLKKDGTPIVLASHSYLIKPSIVSQRCLAAVENVFLIVSLIEQAGLPKRGSRTRTAHIKGCGACQQECGAVFPA